MRHTAAFATLLLLSSGGAALAADGCPDGTVGMPPLPQSGIYPIAFDEMKAYPVVNGNAACHLEVQTDDAPGVIAVYSADFRGFVAPEDTATFRVTHNGVTDEVVLYDELDGITGDFMTTYVGTTLDGRLITDIDLSLASTDNLSFAKLDTLDYNRLGWTTLADVDASLDELSTARTALVTHLGATAALLTGGNQPLTSPDGIGVIGAVGSHTIGVTGQATIGDGWSLAAGIASASQETGGVAVDTLLASGEVRYLAPEAGGAPRWFGIAGVTAAPNMGLDFTRFYDDGSDDGATVTSATHGRLYTAYGEAGMLFEADASNSFALSGEVAQSWLGIDGYSETFSLDNLFPISVADTDGRFLTLKAKANWTTALTDDVDLTLSGAVGHTFADADFDADVMFAGTRGVAGTSEAFAELGARVGWAVNDLTSVDLFTNASFGAETGSHVQAGAGFKMKF